MIFLCDFEDVWFAHTMHSILSRPLWFTGFSWEFWMVGIISKFSMLVVWFIGLNPIRNFPEDSFVLHSIEIVTSTQTSCKESYILFMMQSNKPKSCRINMKWHYNPIFFILAFLKILFLHSWMGKNVWNRMRRNPKKGTWFAILPIKHRILQNLSRNPLNQRSP